MRSENKRRDAEITQRSQSFSCSDKKSGFPKGIWRKLCVLCVIFASLRLITSCQTDEENKRQKYITEGILLYKTHCANCHQTNGNGLQALYPPLAGSDYLANKDSVIHLIRYGQQGPIMVNGKRYNRPMPANKQLSDLEIAEIVTYIYHQWGNEKTLTSVADVKTVFPAR